MTTTPVHLTEWRRLGCDDPTVVMIHGGAQGGQAGGDRNFAAQARLAGRGWRVIAPDRPGHGRSPAPNRPDDAEADAEWVTSLLAGGVHLVGHSFGGAVALLAAARAPSAVRSLTLVEPALLALAFSDLRVQAWIGQVGAALSGATSDADRATKFMALMHAPPEMREASAPADLARVGRGLAELKVPPEPLIRESLETMKREGVPLMVVTGGWSPAFDAVAEVASEVGGGQAVTIASEHHFPMLYDEFNDRLVEFMTGADQRSGKKA